MTCSPQASQLGSRGGNPWRPQARSEAAAFAIIYNIMLYHIILWYNIIYDSILCYAIL